MKPVEHLHGSLFCIYFRKGINSDAESEQEINKDTEMIEITVRLDSLKWNNFVISHAY
jgi:hypothetical protein